MVHSHWSHRAVHAVYTLQASSCSSQYRGAFIAALPIEKLKMTKKVHRAIGNRICSSRRHQHLYVVIKRPHTELFALLAIGSLKLITVRDVAVALKDSQEMDFSKNLRASLFNGDLSNEPTFSQIHLGRQYL